MTVLNFVTVEPVIALNSLAYYLETTTVQDLIFTKVCMEKLNTTDATWCTPTHMHNSSALTAIVHEQSRIISNYFTITGIVSIPVTFYIGAWSDIFGRKRLLVFPFLFYIVSQLCLFASVFLIEGNITPLVYVSAALDGITGGSAGTIAVAFGYIADVTEENSRTKRTAILESMWYIGGSFGYLAVAGMQYIPFRKYEITFGFLASLHFCIVLHVILCIKETRVHSVRTRKMLFDYTHATECVKTAFKSRTPPVKRHLLLLCMVAVIFVTAVYTIQINLSFALLKRPPLKWETSLYGLYCTTITITSGLGLVVILPLILHLGGARIKDSSIIAFGAIMKSAGILVFASANKTWVVFMTAAIFTFSEYALPSIRSTASKIVDEDETGKIFSFIAIVQNIVSPVASYGFGYLFSIFPHFPGLTFYVGAAVSAAVALVFTFFGCFVKGGENYTKLDDENDTEEVTSDQ